eukprot:TRINITY_DN67757_c3_g3_i1.p1 TRINITY_DN67757_c3_g3~~TRINITY_DN67757_c3_g3_i1.p1  ORF type:complete len:456 (-),score=70.10 TRINITY_DN67757_c3_g3_i1:82-1449(-)
MPLSARERDVVKFLEKLLKRPENQECMDCSARNPKWCSYNLGIFLCINCVGVHRSLGTDYSRPRAATALDAACWTDAQLNFMASMGNAAAKEIWEAYLPRQYEKPSATEDVMVMQQWIRTKYVAKRYWRDPKKAPPKSTKKPTLPPKQVGPQSPSVSPRQDSTCDSSSSTLDSPKRPPMKSGAYVVANRKFRMHKGETSKGKPYHDDETTDSGTEEESPNMGNFGKLGPTASKSSSAFSFINAGSLPSPPNEEKNQGSTKSAFSFMQQPSESAAPPLANVGTVPQQPQQNQPEGIFDALNFSTLPDEPVDSPRLVDFSPSPTAIKEKTAFDFIALSPTEGSNDTPTGQPQAVDDEDFFSAALQQTEPIQPPPEATNSDPLDYLLNGAPTQQPENRKAVNKSILDMFNTDVPAGGVEFNASVPPVPPNSEKNTNNMSVDQMMQMMQMLQTMQLQQN